MSSHELFKKHFGNQIAVDLKHPNIENFFEELNEECLQEDKHKKCNIQHVSSRVFF
jgi:RNA binding exosome subunit